MHYSRGPGYLQEAVEWLKQAPFRGTTIEIRRVSEAEDFGDNLTPELQAAEASLREQLGQP